MWIKVRLPAGRRMKNASPGEWSVMLGVAGRLAEHHRHCDELFIAAAEAASAADWALLTARVALLREALLEHFRHEEERIFPIYEETSGEEGATEALCAQHDDMRAALWVLATYSAGADPQRYCAEFADLRATFDVHAADEEQRMYPVFERVLGAGAPRN
jgi:DUF438 domain-containing protein